MRDVGQILASTCIVMDGRREGGPLPADFYDVLPEKAERRLSMKGRLLCIISGALSVLWGIAHLFPTGNIVRGFGSISADNKLIILMEWINAGFTLIFIGLLVITVTFINSADMKVKKGVYVLSFLMFVSMAILSLFTGFRIDFIAFRLCPFIFSLSALLLLLGMLKK
jgi:hypothetical protein